MNILSLGTALFSSHWRAAGHRVLVVADVPLGAHPDNRPFDVFAHPDTCAQRFAAIADAFGPDVVFQGDHSTPLIHAGIEDLTVPKVWYAIDTHLHRAWHPHYAAVFDRVFCAQKNMVTTMSRFQPNVAWLPVFCRQTADFLPWEHRAHDVAFVGTLDPSRNPARVALFAALRQKGIEIHTTTGAFAPVYQSSRIVVNQAVNDDLNLRVFEAMGCGSLLVTDRISHSLNELFDEGRDYLAYAPGDTQECAEKIRWALAHPAEAEAIARSGHSKTVTSHTEAQRAAQVAESFETLKKTGAGLIADIDASVAHLAWAFEHCSRLALPPVLTDFFRAQAEAAAAQGRLGIAGRPWALLVSAATALQRGNAALSIALMNQIAEPPDDPDYRVRLYCLRIEAFLRMGERNQAEEIAREAVREFPSQTDIAALAKVAGVDDGADSCIT